MLAPIFPLRGIDFRCQAAIKMGQASRPTNKGCLLLIPWFVIDVSKQIELL